MSDSSSQSSSPSNDDDIEPSLTYSKSPESQHSNMTSLPTPESRHSNMAIATPSLSTSPQRPVPSAIRRVQSPPRNSANDIICDHPDCINKQPTETFRRLCEWNKHMDRHERPYKCHEPGCELSLGFTYSGGLLRHQREVHKMHLSIKEALYCPFPNCNRSSGAGFTRKENLEEHKRRRHLEEMSQAQKSPSADGTTPTLQPPPTRKRKRLPTTPTTEAEDLENGFMIRINDDDDDDDDIESHPIVKKLRANMAQKDEIIRWQQMEIQRLQSMIRSLPQQAVYNITGMMSAGQGGGGSGQMI